MVTMLLGTSYAWYQFDNAVTNFTGVQTFNADNELEGISVIFSNTNNINTVVGVPLSQTEVAQYSSKTNFSIVPETDYLNNKEVAYQIELIDFSIDSELAKTQDLQWSVLEEIPTGEQNEIARGNFQGKVSGDIITLKQMTKLTNLDTTHEYEFRLWLNDNGGNQNELMGKEIRGKIKVSIIIR